MSRMLVSLSALCVLLATIGCQHTALDCCCNTCCTDCCGLETPEEPMEEAPFPSGPEGTEIAPAPTEPLLPMPKPMPEMPKAVDAQSSINPTSFDLRWEE